MFQSQSVSYNTENWESAPCTRFKVIFYILFANIHFHQKALSNCHWVILNLIMCLMNEDQLGELVCALWGLNG